MPRKSEYYQCYLFWSLMPSLITSFSAGSCRTAYMVVRTQKYTLVVFVAGRKAFPQCLMGLVNG